MPIALNDDVSIYFEDHGEDPVTPVILVQGFTVQLVGWHPRFVAMLKERGLRPVLLDNRDVGLSQKFGGATDLDGGYAISDMADDVIAVADALGAPQVHLVGQSMGGIIVQRAFLSHPDRVASMTLLYTAPGNPVPYVTSENGGTVGLEVAENRQEAIELTVLREREVASSTSYEFDEEWIRELAGISYDRCYDPAGALRQGGAVARETESYLPLLQGNELPVSVIHGRADTVASEKAAIDLAGALPNAELHLFPGMGHALVEPLWGSFADIIARTVGRGATASAQASELAQMR